MTLLKIGWDSADWTFSFFVSFWIVVGVAALIIALLAIRWIFGWSLRNYEIDQAEFGLGQSKFRFRPNIVDKQVAYSIWVELSTRKIGLPIDLKHDVISEIYDSWYNFFSVTRDLVKSVPVTQIKKSSTQKIIKLSIEILNEGLRPHLTLWQARYRAWYDRELKRYEKAKGRKVLDPQQIQATFPQFKELQKDLMKVNKSLTNYRAKMQQLVMND